MKSNNCDLKIKTIAITGSVSSGKSYVSNIIKNLGFPLVSSDEINSKMLKNSRFIKKILDFNENLLDHNGKIDKKKLFNAIFFDDQERSINLLNFIQKNISIRRDRYVAIFHSRFNRKFLFCEIPLLFELNLQKSFNHNVLVYCSKEVRFERFSHKKRMIFHSKNNSSPEDLEFEISKFDVFDKNQIKNYIKKKRSDFVIYNSYNVNIFTYIQVLRMIIHFYFINFFRK